MVILILKILGLVAASFIGLCILRFLFHRPEITFALFLFSYVIEGGDMIPGPIDLTPILLLISLAGFFLPAVRRKSIRYSSKPSDIWILIFLIVLIGGSFLSPDSQSGVEKAILFAIAVILPYTMVRVFFKTYKQIKIFLITILSLAAGVAVILIVMFFLSTYTWGRVQFFEANPIPTGTLLALGLAIVVIGLSSDLLSKSRRVKGICIAIIPLCLFSMFLSGARGPYVSVIVGLAFYLLIQYIRQPRVLISMVGIALFFLVTFNIWYPVIVNKVPNIRAYSPEAIIQGTSTKQRLERYQAAIRLFVQRPLLGGGTNSYFQRTKLDEYPHNIFLEIISENGLIGLLVFLGFLGSVAWAGFRYLKTRHIKFSPQERAIGLTVLVISLTLLVEKQFSYSLTMHKDLLAFLGIIVNLPDLSSSPKVKASKNAVKIMKKLKVLLITNIIPPYRIPLYKYIYQAENFDLKLIALAESEANREWRMAKNQIILNYEVLPGIHKFIRSREIAIHLNWGLWKAILRYKPDIVITSGYDTFAYWSAFLYCKLFKKKYILWNSTTLLSTGRINGFIGKIKKMIIRGADRYIAYGTKASEYLIHMGASKEYIHVGINTVDMNWFRKKAKEFHQDENRRKERSRYPKLLMLYVGQLINRKGIYQLCKALNELRDPNVGLLIVGSGPQGRELKQFCQDKKLENVYFEGFQQQEALLRYYALADVLILPSFKEVWGLVINEALASGIYVLCSNYAGAAYDLIKEEWNGILFDPHSIEELVILIRKAKEQIEDIRARREAISDHACHEFSIERSAKAFSSAFEAVISNKA